MVEIYWQVRNCRFKYDNKSYCDSTSGNNYLINIDLLGFNKDVLEHLILFSFNFYLDANAKGLACRI